MYVRGPCFRPSESAFSEEEDGISVTKSHQSCWVTSKSPRLYHLFGRRTACFRPKSFACRMGRCTSRQKDDPHVAHQISRHHFRTNASFAHHRRCARHAHCALFRRDGGNRRLLCGLQASQYAAAPFCGRGLPAGIRADALRGEGKGARGRRKALHRQCLYGARACRLHRERPRRHRGAASRLGHCGRHERKSGSLYACDRAHALHVPVHRLHESRGSGCGGS